MRCGAAHVRCRRRQQGLTHELPGPSLLTPPPTLHSSKGLVGNTLDCDSGQWVRTDAGVGAGVDSFYEYLLKVRQAV